MKPLQPQIVSQSREGGDKARFKLKLPADLLYFEGHFPSSPILPGVVQIDWAIGFARTLFPIQGEFKGLEALKFQQVLQPGDEPELELEFKPAKNAFSFRYLSSRGRHSSGTAFFG